MNRIITVMAVCCIAMAAAGCDRNPVEKAGQGLLGTVEHSKTVADQATLEGMNRSVQAFRVENGRNPESLDELERFAGKPLDREKYAYNPATGMITARQ